MNYNDNNATTLVITLKGLKSNANISGATKTVITSASPMDVNSFEEPTKVHYVSS